MTAELAIARRSFRQVWIGATSWAAVFGVTVASSALTYANSYPDRATRLRLAATTGRDRGMAMLLGPVSGIGTVAGYTVYKCFVFLTTIGAVWGLLVATRLLRGEEDSGRWQLVLAGATRRGRATVATLVALFGAVGVLFVGTTVIALLAGRSPDLKFGTGATVLYGASLVVPAAVFVAVGALTSQLGASRRVATSLGMLVFGVAFVALWLGLAQPLATLPRFVAAWGEVGGGYTEGMSFPGRADEIVAAVALGAAVLAMVTLAERQRRLSGLLATGAVAALVALAVKGAFVRHDAHALRAPFTLAVVAALYALPGARGRGVRAALLCLTLAFVWVLQTRYGGPSPWRFVVDDVAAMPSRARGVAALVSDPALVRDGFAANLAAIRVATPIPPVAGTVDVYPWRDAVAIAHGLRYDPRPVMQSYAAFTGALAARNVEHLRGPRAPDSLLFAVAPIDGRYPSLDDGPSWPELLTRYDVADAAGGFLLLRRAHAPRVWSLEPLVATTGVLGEPIAVPPADGGPVWASIDVQPTALGRLAALLLKPPRVRIAVTARDGRRRDFVLVPAMARDGFLLSPLVEATPQWALLASRDPPSPDADVTAVVVAPEWGGRRFHRAAVAVSLSRLRFPAEDVSRITALRPLVALAEAEVRSGSAVRFGAGPGGGDVLRADAPSEIAIAVAPGVGHVRLGFGILDGAWQGGGATDGVVFRASAVASGRSLSLWSRTLDPLNQPADRGPQSADVALPAGPIDTVLLATEPGATSAWDWAYWSDVTREP